MRKRLLFMGNHLRSPGARVKLVVHANRDIIPLLPYLLMAGGVGKFLQPDETFCNGELCDRHDARHSLKKEDCRLDRLSASLICCSSSVLTLFGVFKRRFSESRYGVTAKIGSPG